MNKDEKNKSKNGDKARQRLLDAAEKLFAEHGFDGVPVRDITSLANCNVAAINYHFGGKDKLYLEIMKNRMETLREIRINSIKEVMSRPGTTLEDLLRAFSWAFLNPLVDEESGAQLMKLMIREMLDPHLPSNMLFEKVIKPVVNELVEGIMKACPGIDMLKAAFCIHSIVAQLLHTIHTTKMLAKVESLPLPWETPTFEDFVDHIVEFSAAAIRSFADKAREINA